MSTNKQGPFDLFANVPRNPDGSITIEVVIDREVKHRARQRRISIERERRQYPTRQGEP